MEYLGGRNLFTSHFIIGCGEVNREFTKTETLEIEALHKWLDFKDNDWGMNRYRTDRTQYIDFLEIIELETFKEITEGLYKSYSNEFPYSTKKDFIKHVFDYTIFDLECFLKLDLHWLGEPPNENNYSFYTVYSHDDREFLDFAIKSKFEISHYKQYYKAVLEYLKSFESDMTGQDEEQNKALPPQQSEKKKPELKLKDFFIKDYSTDVIADIQTKFKELEGKELAILIYLLHKEYQIIEILTNSRTKGRKSFVKCLKETDNPTMQRVNKCFTPNTDDLIYSKDDLVFQSLNKKLTETIKK